jgi:hypothetical protein
MAKRNDTKKLDQWTLRLATISGAVQAAGNIVINHAKADDPLQHASDILDLTVLEIERLRIDLVRDCQRQVSHG